MVVSPADSSEVGCLEKLLGSPPRSLSLVAAVPFQLFRSINSWDHRIQRRHSITLNAQCQTAINEMSAFACACIQRSIDGLRFAHALSILTLSEIYEVIRHRP